MSYFLAFTSAILIQPLSLYELVLWSLLKYYKLEHFPFLLNNSKVTEKTGKENIANLHAFNIHLNE